MGKLAILGAVGNCLDIVDAWSAARSASLTQDELVGFLDDGRLGSVVAGFPVLGPLALAGSMDGVRFICGIGGPRSYRQKPQIIARLALPQERYAAIVHPAATVSPSARIGTGSCILAHATVCANVAIGMHVMMLPGCVIGHDTMIGDCSILAAGVIVSGNVRIDRNCYLGAGSVLRDGVSIGERAMVGLGAGVVGDVEGGTIVTGLPARRREVST
jgi:sugar O-acyltransferase (sialic acid O-acetyltransferase NeuD family)